MNSQNIGDDSMNFSVIDKNEQKIANIDFSLGQLLQDGHKPALNIQEIHAEKNDREQVFKKMKQLKQTSINRTQIRSNHRNEVSMSNNFLKDLQKMEKQLSFQTQEYNIYEDNPNNSAEIVSNNKSKTFSTLKFTKQSKSISKCNYTNFNQYFGDLILDFHKVESKLKANKQSKNSSSNVSNQNSIPINQKNSKINKAKELQKFFRSKQKDSIKKSHKFTSPQQVVKRSKSKSLNQKLKPMFKSPKNIKFSTEIDDFSSNVYSQYYVSDSNFNKPLDNKNLAKKKKCSIIENIYNNSKDKVMLKSKSKSKSKINLLSPRGKKTTIKTIYSKK